MRLRRRLAGRDPRARRTGRLRLHTYADGRALQGQRRPSPTATARPTATRSRSRHQRRPVDRDQRRSERRRGLALQPDPGRGHRPGHGHRHQLHRPLGRRQHDTYTTTAPRPTPTPTAPTTTTDRRPGRRGRHLPRPRERALGAREQRRAVDAEPGLAGRQHDHRRQHACLRLERLHRPGRRERHDHLPDPGRQQLRLLQPGEGPDDELVRLHARRRTCGRHVLLACERERRGRRHQRLQLGLARHDRHRRAERAVDQPGQRQPDQSVERRLDGHVQRERHRRRLERLRARPGRRCRRRLDHRRERQRGDLHGHREHRHG